MPASDKTALECVMEADAERHRLEKEAEELGHDPSPGNDILLSCHHRGILMCNYILDHSSSAHRFLHWGNVGLSLAQWMTERRRVGGSRIFVFIEGHWFMF